MSVVTEISGDERRLLEALRKSERAIDERLIKALKKTTNEAKEADRELAAFAKKTQEIDTTPLERLNKELDKVKRAKDAKLLSDADFLRASSRIEGQIKALNAPIVENAAPALQQVKTLRQELEAGLAAGMGSLQTMAVGYLSIETAVGLARQVTANYNEQMQIATNRTDQLADARRKLAQVSPGGNFASFDKEANQLTNRTGLDPLLARQLLFDANSLNYSDNKGLIDLLARGQSLMDVRASAQAAGRLPRITRGKLSGEDSLDLVAAASEAARITMEEMTPTLAKVMEQSSRTGATPTEVAAAMARLSFVLESPEQRGAAFFGAVAADENLRQKTFPEQMSSLINDDGLRERILGNNKEALAFYEAARDELGEILNLNTEIAKKVYEQSYFLDKISGSKTKESLSQDMLRMSENKRNEWLENNHSANWRMWEAASNYEQDAINRGQGALAGSAYKLLGWGSTLSWMRGMTPDEHLDARAQFLESTANGNAGQMEVARYLREGAAEMRSAAAVLNKGAQNHAEGQRARAAQQRDQ